MRQQTLALAVCAALAAMPGLAAETGNPQSLLIQQGYYWQAKEHPDRAAEAWSKLLNLSPEQPDALYGLGLIDLQQKRLDGARQYLARLQAIKPLPRLALQLEQDIALSPGDKQQLLEKARELSDADERDKAVAVYRQLLDGHQPQGLIAREYYNTLGFSTGGWPEARVGLERLRRERPDDAILDLFLALHLARNSDSRPEGIRALARLSHNPDIGGNADETWRFALQWLGPPSRDQVSLFQQYLQAHPDDAEIRALMDKGIAQGRGGSGWQRDPQVARGLKAIDAGDIAGAEQALQARLKERPNDYDALGGMGIVRQQQKRLGEAESYLIQATRLPGGAQWNAALEDVRYWILLDQAGDAQRAGRQSQARALIDQAIAKNPAEPAGPTALANWQSQAGQLDAAEAGYRQVLARTANYPEALAGLINVLSRAGKSDEALRLIDGLSAADQARLAPTVKIRSLRAIQVAKLAERRGDLAAAQKAYKEALADDPKNPWTRFALARVYLRDGQTQVARDLIDELLKQQPDQPDALYTSTLLSAELGEWTKAQRTLSRIPAAKRSSDMNDMELDIRLHIQTELAVDVAHRGQRQESWALLSRCEPLAGQKPERVAVLASAYAEAGNPQQAVNLMRQVLDHSPSTPDLQLLYAGVLLKADQDAQASEILRDLQGKPMSETASKRYEDLLFLYRIKQADELREKNDLVAAFDMLSPALKQRPNDSQAVSSLARMYAASGNTQKARELYEPLIKADPGNAKLQLGLADVALQGRDFDLAEQSVKKALELEPGVPQTLTASARIYRGMGKTGEAGKLLRKAIEIEDSQRQEIYVAAAPQAATQSANPFVGLPGQRREATALASSNLVPPPINASVVGLGSGLGARDGDTVPTAVGRGTGIAANSVNPFDDPYARESTSRPTLSPAQQALNEIVEDRTGYAVQGLTVRSNNGEKGLSKLTDVEAPFEVSVPVGDNSASMALQITPVSLSSGSPGNSAQARFGASGLDPVGSQTASGLGVAVAYRDKEQGLKADLGVSPMGFIYSTPIGGVSLNRPFDSNSDYRYGVSVSRRAVTDSVTSFAGSRDPRTGDKWGGVTANGVRGELSYDDQKFGAYGYGSAHVLQGNNVESNNRFELGSGIYWYLRNAPDSILTLGLSGSALTYANNQDFFTVGHGGYFSPQTFFALGVPISWSQRTENFTYRVKGSVGVQHIGQDSAEVFPGNSNLQPQATAAGLTGYGSESKTGVGYSLNAAGEYKFGSRFFLGGTLGVDNASDYRQLSGGVYLRYTFENMTGPMALPVSPFGSPYSN
ncbi:cellulose synthase subunit BcsC-related outer membrane protein [Pseudomonas gingeri]|uniref:BCSC C-terminal domain-containing protein n=1 Tax=Pseudomonas gingeri TaxID=117681 RepID=A0A7Y7WNX6_9PSED|nr:cellulose synthase subunit BcsC-related outer membrane protein [Pseudomonas gingeri]NWB84667.1 BCSC C-terminal domain-containing protein [Pseudomonas gingeri]